MAVPGPSFPLGIVDLVGILVVFAVAGEGVRILLARYLPVLRRTDFLDRFVLDVYLAGALTYGVTLIPHGAASPWPGLVALAVGIAVTTATLVGIYRRGRLSATVANLLGTLRRPGVGVAVAMGLLLSVGGLFLASSVPSGNTFDASVDSLFVVLLNGHGSLPTTLAPVANGAIAYPQGTTVWLSSALTLGLGPIPRTPILLSPLFVGLAPIAGYLVGRRWLGTDSGGAAVALTMAVIGWGTRYFVAGSYDFVVAYPLVLYLVALGREWVQRESLDWRFGLVFGGLLGYSAVLNPVGAEWILTTLILLPFLLPSRVRSSASSWITAWLVAAAFSTVWVVPSIVGIVGGGAAGAPGSPPGIPVGEFVSLSDPFVVRWTVGSFSPFPFLTAELDLLLLAGVLLLLWPGSEGRIPRSTFGPWAVSGALAALLWLAGGLGARLGVPGLGWVGSVTSFGEMSTLLFTVLGLVGAVPLAILLDRASLPRRAGTSPDPVPVSGRVPPVSSALLPRSVVPIFLALVLLVPGGVVALTDGPEYADHLYRAFANVTTADYDLLEWASDHLPAGARVLVAPGSAAQFLPAYCPRVVLLFPMTGPDWRANREYLELGRFLANGTLGPAGMADLSTLQVAYVAVTGNSSVLYPAFSPVPFVGNPSFTALFTEGDAHLFAVGGAA
ncbi:MAG TPA: hypothetical protein VEY07_03930 [Thermoplasmata archaeon]|nr:hypothetical protein [Thermoplasmata archaeon]